MKIKLKRFNTDKKLRKSRGHNENRSNKKYWSQ